MKIMFNYRHFFQLVDPKFDDSRMFDILRRLKDDSELHKLLVDERMRCQLHKTNYDKLKAEYTK